jgi:K+/H+ antiporter YhaU regulatory subunit KhtT
MSFNEIANREKMSSKNISIREGNQRDIAAIMGLIYLKAEFDGCPESVEGIISLSWKSVSQRNAA